MTVIALTGSIDRPEKAAAAAQAARYISAQALQEWDLIQRAQQFEDSALTWLYQTYYPKVYNYAFLHLGDPAMAEDLASDVMVKVLESLKDYRFRGVPFAAWVFRIAHNRVIDVHRRRKRRGEVDLKEDLVAALDDPSAAAERAFRRGQLQAALLLLTEEQRQTIILKFIEGFDNASVAQILGRSQGAVKSLQHRALASLRRILAEGKP